MKYTFKTLHTFVVCKACFFCPNFSLCFRLAHCHIYKSKHREKLYACTRSIHACIYDFWTYDFQYLCRELLKTYYKAQNIYVLGFSPIHMTYVISGLFCGGLLTYDMCVTSGFRTYVICHRFFRNVIISVFALVTYVI